MRKEIFIEFNKKPAQGGFLGVDRQRLKPRRQDRFQYKYVTDAFKRQLFGLDSMLRSCQAL